jgi:hypothetical protein
MRWVSNGEIVSNDGETATAEIPEKDGSSMLVTGFVIKRCDTHYSRARFLDEFHIGARIEIFNEIDREPRYRILHNVQF